MDKELLLKAEVQGFINDHINDDIPSLILKKSAYPHLPINEIAEQIVAKRKASKKLPTWFNTDDIIYPPAVSIEQSSSEITAKYKASLIGGKSALDLTGGFGVDTYHFSTSFEKMDYVEANQHLASLASHNFNILEANNIKTHALSAEEYLSLKNLKYDLIYIDPDRRPSQTRVYGFDDSTPKLLDILPTLKAITSNILIKASPMMDISLAREQLGIVDTVIILAVENEVKELLFWITERSAINSKTRCVDIVKNKEVSFEINDHAEGQEECSYGYINKFLFEPNAAIMKAGAFGILCKRYSVNKLHRNTNLFTAVNRVDSFPGRVFEVKEDISYKKSEVIAFLDDKRANVSVRNFIDTPEQVKKKLGLKDGGEYYLFGYKNIKNQYRIAICTKLAK